MKFPKKCRLESPKIHLPAKKVLTHAGLVMVDGAAMGSGDSNTMETKIERILLEDPDFPSSLRDIPAAPKGLYIKGRLSEAPRVAVVGARRSDQYGLEIARALGAGLAKAGVCVVSGGASGVDTAALRACLDTGGSTVAVLGTGLDLAYPASNKRLFEEIAETGALLSEYPPGTPGLPGHFPKRNRIISGLTSGVVVVRAALKSGSLITAREAARQGRRVMAVPGPAQHELSAGVHQLLRRGASLVEDANDVLSVLKLKWTHQIELGLAAAGSQNAEELLESIGSDERLLYDALNDDACPIDVLVGRTGLPSSQVAAILLEMEFKGLVSHQPGMVYRKVHARSNSIGVG